MELTYTKCGDYLIPDLLLSDTKEYHIGKYGWLRRAYLKEHWPILYADLIVTEKLFPHLEEIDTACWERLEIPIWRKSTPPAGSGWKLSKKP